MPLFCAHRVLPTRLVTLWGLLKGGALRDVSCRLCSGERLMKVFCVVGRIFGKRVVIFFTVNSTWRLRMWLLLYRDRDPWVLLIFSSHLPQNRASVCCKIFLIFLLLNVILYCKSFPARRRSSPLTAFSSSSFEGTSESLKLLIHRARRRSERVGSRLIAQVAFHLYVY